MRTIVFGDIIFAESSQSFRAQKDAYMILVDGMIESLESKRPEEMEGDQFLDFRHKLIVPGFADLHLHAPQFPNIGLGADMELLPWLEKYTFPEESKYKDLDYARMVYRKLINRLWSAGTLYSGIYATIHEESSTLLFDLLVQSGLYAKVGKVNMDRNSPDYYVEDTKESVAATERFILKNLRKSSRVTSIVTPRFVPSCTSELMQALGNLAATYDLSVQSHLDENRSEIDWVCSLHPSSESYAHVYQEFGLFGAQPTLMAHCIYCSEEEIRLLADSDVVAVHCPFSNANLISGIMPVKTYLKQGVHVALGSDISGGHELSMPKVMVLSMQLSKMLAVSNAMPNDFLSTVEAFYLGTKSGGSFFGKHGSLEPGYHGDFLVIDDESYRLRELSIEERLEKFLYVGRDEHIIHRFVDGQEVRKPFPEQ